MGRGACDAARRSRGWTKRDALWVEGLNDRDAVGRDLGDGVGRAEVFESGAKVVGVCVALCWEAEKCVIKVDGGGEVGRAGTRRSVGIIVK